MSNPRPRATLAPFVGVALAALTIGSLVTFSLIAQRASLEGFSARGVTAQAPVAASPESIVVPARVTGPAPSSDTDAPVIVPAPAPSATALLVSLPDTETIAPAGNSTTTDGRDPEAPRDEPAGRLPIGPIAASRSDDGSARADDAQDAHKRSKREKPSGSDGARSAGSNGGRDHAGLPPDEAKPERSSKPEHTPVAKGHVKAKGRGHHKDRGRGHDKD